MRPMAKDTSRRATDQINDSRLGPIERHLERDIIYTLAGAGLPQKPPGLDGPLQLSLEELAQVLRELAHVFRERELRESIKQLTRLGLILGSDEALCASAGAAYLLELVGFVI